MRKTSFALVMLTVLALTACTASTGVGATQPSFSDQVASVVAGTLQALPPSKTPEPSPQPTDEPGCPDPTQGMKLFTQESMGYCLLYPQGYLEIYTDPAQVCLVPEGPTMGCHNANAFINVEPAAGRTADQIADEAIADAEAVIPGIGIRRTGATVSGESAVVLEGLPGVASSRNVVVVHDGRLYELIFVPWDETGEDFARIESLYETIIHSFSFLPATAWTPSPAQSTPIPSTSTPIALACPNALPTRLQVGGYAFVSLDPPLSNRVRNGPGPDNRIIGDIEPGEAMKILKGPECAQDRLWWEVQALEGGLTGWTAEGDNKDYWLVPCSSPTNCGVP